MIRRTERMLHLLGILVSVLRWTDPSSMVCNAWVSTASSSSSAGGGASTFPTRSNTVASAHLPRRTKLSTFDRRYWMVLNAVVDDQRQGRNSTTVYDNDKPSTKIMKTSTIFVDRWNSMFQRLKEYKKTYGNTNVPKKYNDGKKPALGNWVSKQRFEALVYKKTNGEEGQITSDRISKLESIGFVWKLGRQDEWEEKWLGMFSELKAFQKKYMSTKVPILDNKELKSSQATSKQASTEYPMSILGRWVKTQRIQRSKLLRGQPAPAMSTERLEMLESIDFAWSGKRVTEYDMWLNMYFKLWFYYQQHNTTIISDSDGEGNSRLREWTEEQRSIYGDLHLSGKTKSLLPEADHTEETLTQHCIDLLNEINFDWSVCNKDSWEDMYNELVEYKENFNSTLVSTKINERLGKWTIMQRRDHNSLGSHQILKLDAIGFDWNATQDVYSNNWGAMMDRFDAYKRKHNTAVVPNHDGGDRSLANWVNNQRVKLGKYVLNDDFEYYSSHDLVDRIALDMGCTPKCEFEPKGFIRRLSPATYATRIRMLNASGFVWDAQEASWQGMYQRLLEYREENNGSTMVPHSSQEPTSSEQSMDSLGVWVKEQRYRKQQGEMSEKRLSLLNEVDFVWDPLEAQWTEMFDRLCAYQEEHDGSTTIPLSYPPDPDLGIWVNTQRRAYKRRTLPDDRIQRLDSIAFLWELQ